MTSQDKIKNKKLELENILTNTSEYIYDECTEMKRKVQLETEEKIFHYTKASENELYSEMVVNDLEKNMSF